MYTYSLSSSPLPAEWYELRGYDIANDDFSHGALNTTIRGLEEETYTVPVMQTSCWDAMVGWLTLVDSEEVMDFDEIVEDFEDWYGAPIEWVPTV